MGKMFVRLAVFILVVTMILIFDASVAVGERGKTFSISWISVELTWQISFSPPSMVRPQASKFTSCFAFHVCILAVACDRVFHSDAHMCVCVLASVRMWSYFRMQDCLCWLGYVSSEPLLPVVCCARRISSDDGSLKLRLLRVTIWLSSFYNSREQ